MAGNLVHDFPLFPLGLVALPSELIPLHIFEERYKTMIGRCMDEGSEFGIVWVSDDGIKEIGCACAVEEVLERLPDGRMNLLVKGTRVFRIDRRQDDLPYPAGVVEFVDDDPGDDPQARVEAQKAYAELVSSATDKRLDPLELAAMTAYEMAATVEFGAEAKQGLLALRSEPERLRMVARLFRAALKRLEFVEQAEVRARSNGRIRFP